MLVLCNTALLFYTLQGSPSNTEQEISLSSEQNLSGGKTRRTPCHASHHYFITILSPPHLRHTSASPPPATFANSHIIRRAPSCMFRLVCSRAVAEYHCLLCLLCLFCYACFAMLVLLCLFCYACYAMFG